MKKFRLMALMAMLVMVAGASAQVNLGIKGGVNMSNYYGDELNEKNVKIGFHVGLAAEYEFVPGSALQTGLFFTTKGLKTEDTDWNAKYSENLMYLQLPVHYAYKMDVTPGTRLVFHGGPYIAYGVGGSRKASVGNINAEWDVDNIFGDGLVQYKPFDAGLGLGVGAEFGPILFDLGWDMGLVNISRTSNGDIKNQNAYLSVGYKF